MEFTIKYRGVALEIIGDPCSEEKGGWWSRSYGVEFETNTVYAGGVEITDLLSEEQLGDIDILAVERSIEHLNQL